MKSAATPYATKISRGGAERLQNQGSGLTDGTFVRPTGNALKLVKDISEIKEAITWVKERGEEWHTNFYADDERVKYWINERQLCMFKKDNTLILLRSRPMQWQMYICNTDETVLAADLSEVLSNIEDNVSTDILGQSDVMKNALRVGEFRSYMLLHRITLTYDDSKMQYKPFDEKWFANEDDLPGIMEILYENMDPKCEQIPDPKEFLQDIRNHNVLTIYTDDGKELAAFLSFHRKGKLLHWEYWASRKKFRKEKLGLRLYAPYMQLNWDVKRHVGFVRDDNPMIEVYEYMGFHKDGLKDEVFVRDGKNNIGKNDLSLRQLSHSS